MKKILFTILAASTAMAISSCNNGGSQTNANSAPELPGAENNTTFTGTINSSFDDKLAQSPLGIVVSENTIMYNSDVIESYAVISANSTFKFNTTVIDGISRPYSMSNTFNVGGRGINSSSVGWQGNPQGTNYTFTITPPMSPSDDDKKITPTYCIDVKVDGNLIASHVCTSYFTANDQWGSSTPIWYAKEAATNVNVANFTATSIVDIRFYSGAPVTYNCTRTSQWADPVCTK